jgi:hypothetical protein
MGEKDTEEKRNEKGDPANKIAFLNGCSQWVMSGASQVGLALIFEWIFCLNGFLPDPNPGRVYLIRMNFFESTKVPF